MWFPPKLPPNVPPTETSNPKQRLRRRPIVYQPSIYSSTCRGLYTAHSHTEGVCHGFESKLEEQMTNYHELLTRQEALKRFSAVSIDTLDDYNDEGSTDLYQSSQSLLVTPALIFNDDNADTKVPEEESITRQSWDCYGSTQVDYLVLTHPQNGSKKIVAVTPQNVGVSFREIETQDTLRNITRVSLGFLDIIHDNNSRFVDAEHHQQQTNNDTSSFPEEVPPRPTTDTLQFAKDQLEKSILFSQKVAQHMSYTLNWLAGNLADDFAGRWYRSGTRIVQTLPHTTHSTLHAMEKLLGKMLDDSGYDDNDDDDNHGAV